MAIPASSISEVISELDGIIETCLVENNKMGLFAALYRKVTQRVQEGIAQERFEDGARMEKLDVLFANRFLEAYQDYRALKPITGSWRLTFEAARKPNLHIMQHLLAGMNTHISLDLGIATAAVSIGQPLSVMERDFNQINHVLSDLIDTVQEAMGKSSPALAVLDWVAGKWDEKFAKANLEHFRKRAWDVASQLAHLNDAARQQMILALDAQVMRENWWFTDLSSRLLPAFIRLATLVQNRKVADVIRAFNTI
jgi:hypothetical protein